MITMKTKNYASTVYNILSESINTFRENERSSLGFFLGTLWPWVKIKVIDIVKSSVMSIIIPLLKETGSCKPDTSQHSWLLQ